MRLGTLSRYAAISGSLVVSFAGVSHGQLPGTPVLQNAFVNPGITAAVNVANLGGSSSYAAAAAWAPGSARFQLSAGIGLQTHTANSTHTLFGGRLNFPIFGANGNLGVSAFAGYGALTGGTIDSTVAKALMPIGATVSYRREIGSNRGVSMYASPVYEAVSRGGGASSVSVFRGDVGMDIGITSSIGVTLGIEFGGKEPDGSGKPTGTAFGAALSYAIGAGR